MADAGKAVIRTVRRNGFQTWRVGLSCEHSIVLTRKEFARLQWFIGRTIYCPKCLEKQ